MEASGKQRPRIWATKGMPEATLEEGAHLGGLRTQPGGAAAFGGPEQEAVAWKEKGYGCESWARLLPL